MKAINKFVEKKNYSFGMKLILISFLKFLVKEGYLADETYEEMKYE